MHVGGHPFRFGTVELPKTRDDFPESAIGLAGFQIADVLAKENVASYRHRHRVFQMPADGEDARRHRANLEWEWSIAAGPAQNQLPAGKHPNDGVVDLAEYRAIVHQKPIRNPLQSLDRFVLVDANGLIGEVTAGRHHRCRARS